MGGVAGTALRIGIDELLSSVAEWPLGTLVANLIGCLLLGVMWGRGASPAQKPTVAPRARRVTVNAGVMVGFCGGLTTFSSFVLYAVTDPGGIRAALVWIIGSIVAGVVAFVGGRRMGQQGR